MLFRSTPSSIKSEGPVTQLKLIQARGTLNASPSALGKPSEVEVNNNIIFAGSVANIDEYYNKSKIFSFTSTSEGFPNALAEALSVPLACISFDCVTGPSDLIEDGVNGFLVTDFDHDGYKKKLLQLMQDEGLRKKLQQAAEKSIRQFRIENIGQQYLDFILTD